MILHLVRMIEDQRRENEILGLSQQIVELYTIASIF